MKYKLMEVEWMDHWSHHSGWTPINQFNHRDGFKVISVGYVVYESPKTLSLASTVNEQGEVGSTMNIIKSCIRKKRVLKQ